MDAPIISVITVCYNVASTIEKNNVVCFKPDI